MQREQKVIAWPIGAMDGESPAVLVDLRADFRAMARNARLVVRAPVLRAPGGDLGKSFRLPELDPPRERKGLFNRIDDLHQVALRAGGRQSRQRRADVLDRAP